MKAQHTPGPWKIGAYESGLMAVDGVNGEEVTGFVDPANARLIAAAPELLASLKELVAQIEGRFFALKHDHVALQNARDAIAKAIGKETTK